MVACTGGRGGGGASIYLFTDYSRKYNRSDHPHRVQDQYGGLYRGEGRGGASIYLFTDYSRKYNRSDHPHRIQDQYGGLYRGRGGGVQVFICLLTIPGNITGLITHTEYKISMVACTGGRGGGVQVFICLLTIPGNITGLITHTEYKISMVACTGVRGEGGELCKYLYDGCLFQGI